jgi:hypothetical protein
MINYFYLRKLFAYTAQNLNHARIDFMAILQQMTRLSMGNVGVTPGVVFLNTEATYAEITAAGFIKNSSLLETPISESDFVMAVYGTAPSQSLGIFQPSISSSGVITLVTAVGGEVTLPVTSGHFAMFDGTTGTINDEGYSPSDATKTKVAMVNASPTSGNIAKFSDAVGTVADAGFAVKAAQTAQWAGGGVSNAFTATGVTTGSIVTATMATSTNAVYIERVSPGSGSITVTFSADPGANTSVFYHAITPAV